MDLVIKNRRRTHVWGDPSCQFCIGAPESPIKIHHNKCAGFFAGPWTQDDVVYQIVDSPEDFVLQGLPPCGGIVSDHEDVRSGKVLAVAKHPTDHRMNYWLKVEYGDSKIAFVHMLMSCGSLAAVLVHPSFGGSNWTGNRWTGIGIWSFGDWQSQPRSPRPWHPQLSFLVLCQPKDGPPTSWCWTSAMSPSLQANRPRKGAVYHCQRLGARSPTWINMRGISGYFDVFPPVLRYHPKLRVASLTTFWR